MTHIDLELRKAISSEEIRQQNQVELIASENIVSRNVREAQGSILTNKYAEGYPGKRYYGGCEAVDLVENLAIERICKLFGAKFANVQPHSGVNANLATIFALIKPGDKIMGLDLSCGGHLTHGSPVNFTGQWFEVASYFVDKESELIDYDDMAKRAREQKPRFIFAGGSAYPRVIDFKRMREIADEVGAYLVADIAHYAGLIVTGLYPNPVPYAHVVTSTTHKTLRGPRGGIILTNDADIAKKINKAVFPGTQGGPLMHVIAAKAAAFHEALQPSFTHYSRQIIQNAKQLAMTLEEGGLRLVTGGTDCHLVLVDLRPFGINGKDAVLALENYRLTANKNTVPFDTLSPTITSGIRFGTPAGTTRGFKNEDFFEVGKIILDILNRLKDGKGDDPRIHKKVSELIAKYPIHGGNHE